MRLSLAPVHSCVGKILAYIQMPPMQAPVNRSFGSLSEYIVEIYSEVDLLLVGSSRRS